MMTQSDSNPGPPLEQFELAWKHGSPPDVRQFAAEQSNSGRNLLSELVILNFACMWECKGDASPVGVYLNRFPEFRNDSAVLFELLVIEILNWPHPDRSNYLVKFPKLRPELNRLFDLLSELCPDKVREWRDSLTQFTIGRRHSISIAEMGVPVPDLKLSKSITMSDRFEIGRFAGGGGFKRVYRGKQDSTGRQVALKQLKETSPRRNQRFVSEGRIQAALDHQNIPPIAMLGPREDQPSVLVEKFIDAREWAKFIRDRNTSLRRNLNILLTVSRTVAFAHERHIIHRDIKPQNVLVDDFEQVYLTDWGLAAQFGDTDDRDELLSHVQDDAGRIVGTPFYMPPEMALGRSDLMGPATDVFQLGSVLYEILAQRGPFGMTPATAWIRAAGHQFPELPRSLSKEYRAVVAKAMAQKPSDRYANAGAFADDLQRLIDDEEVSACKPPISKRLQRSARKHKTVVVSFGVAFLAALLVAIGASVVVAEKNNRLQEANGHLESSNREVQELNTTLSSKNRELDATNIRLEESIRSLDQRNRELADANKSLREERDRLELSLEIGFKLLRGIETEQYHSLDDAYSDIWQNGFRLPDEERSAMLPLYQALVSIQKAIDFQMQGPESSSGVSGLLTKVTSKAAAARELNTALGQLNQSIQVSDQVGLAWLLRAQLKMEYLSHPKQDALNDWHHAVALLPRCSAAFSGRGFARIGMKDLDQAAIDLARAIELDPSNEYAHYGLAEIQLNREVYDSAIEHYHAALNLPRRYIINPEWRRILYRGAAYSHWGRAPQRLKAGDTEGAFEDSRVAVEFCPAADRPALWSNLLVILAELKPDSAIAKQLRATTSVFDGDEDSETFRLTRDCLVAVAAARAGTLESAEVDRLIQQVQSHSTGNRSVIREITGKVIERMKESLATQDTEPESRAKIAPLIELLEQRVTNK